jgi:alpha-D-xyloside xylohydrolase
VTYKVKKENIAWERAGWAGCQRYPVHWGGDSRANFDGLAGTICGGLHLGLSGFAFWSHDVGGFLGSPDIFKDHPADDLYARWAQVGALSSHMRFHGTTPREPWEFPTVSAIVRQWLRFRYALLPYLYREARACCGSGLPMFRSLVIEWPDDPAVWSISDEYMLGSALLVCPVQCTDQFDAARKFSIVFDGSFKGFDQSELRAMIDI